MSKRLNFVSGKNICFVILIESCFIFHVFAENPPTLAEIADANTKSWNAVLSVEMDYAVIDESHLDGTEFLTKSLHNRWIATPQKERLIRVYDLGDAKDSQNQSAGTNMLLSDSLLDSDSLREHQAAPSENGEPLFCGTISPAIHPLWNSRVNLSPYLLRYPCGEMDMDTNKTLAWILSHWNATLEKSCDDKNGTLWQIRVQCPDELPWHGGTMKISVNADKGFLVQKVVLNGLELNSGIVEDDESEIENQKSAPRTTVEMEIVEFVPTEDGGSFFPSGFVCRQFSEPLTPQSTPHTVYKEIPTRLNVNGKLPDNCFDFQFAKGEIVTQYDSASEITAVFLWGENGKPEHTFASYEELDRWQFRQDILVFAADCMLLTRVFGNDVGHFLRDTAIAGQRYLAAERQQRQERLQALAPLPINNSPHLINKSPLTAEKILPLTPETPPPTAVVLTDEQEKSPPTNAEVVPVNSVQSGQ